MKQASLYPIFFVSGTTIGLPCRASYHADRNLIRKMQLDSNIIIIYYSIPFRSVPFDSIPFHSILLYSILFYSILFYSILFYSILFYSILFCSISFYSILPREKVYHLLLHTPYSQMETDLGLVSAQKWKRCTVG